MNLAPLLRWGRQAMRWLDQPERVAAEGIDPQPMIDQRRGRRWLDGDLSEWEILLHPTERTEQVIRGQGLYRGVHRLLENTLSAPGPTPRTQRMGEPL